MPTNISATSSVYKTIRLGHIQNHNWFVFYTAPRAEKAIYKQLLNMEYEVYLPIRKCTKKYNCRHTRIIEEVVFPGYIFVHTTEAEIYKIKSMPKIVTFIHTGGKPSIIPLQVMKGLQIMLDIDQNFAIENNLSTGELVRIISGPLDGYEGILVTKNGKTRFGIQLKEIEKTVYIDLNTSKVEKIRN